VGGAAGASAWTTRARTQRRGGCTCGGLSEEEDADQGRSGSHARAELRGAARSVLGGCGSAWSGRARPGWCRAPVDAGAASVRVAVDVGHGSWARHRAVCARGGSAGSGSIACRARGLGGAGGSGVGELGRGARWREEQSEVEEGRRAQGALDAMEQGGRGWRSFGGPRQMEPAPWLESACSMGARPWRPLGDGSRCSPAGDAPMGRRSGSAGVEGARRPWEAPALAAVVVLGVGARRPWEVLADPPPAVRIQGEEGRPLPRAPAPRAVGAGGCAPRLGSHARAELRGAAPVTAAPLEGAAPGGRSLPGAAAAQVGGGCSWRLLGGREPPAAAVGRKKT
jgi:hypothetical protein